MTPASARRLPRGLFALILIIASSVLALSKSDSSAVPNSVDAVGCADLPAVRAFPEIHSTCGPPLEYLGVYDAEGKFSRPSNATRACHGAQRPAEQGRPSEVPPGIRLHSLERVIENYETPVHSKHTIHEHSIFSAVRDEIVTFAYGWEKVLQAPQQITTDSAGRIIVTDPAADAVHILNGKNSFRIVGGPHRRFLAPNAVAVDARDKIYVVDSARGLVLVYDRDGRFVKYLGRRGNESIFHSPTAIAIDRVAEKIYLLDTARNLLLVLDLEGNVIRRIGRYHDNGSPIEFNAPTALVLARNELVILDSHGARVQILDPEGKLTGRFVTGIAERGEPVSQMGLGVDSEGNIYVSNLGGPVVRVYDQAGRRLSAFGGTGTNLGEFLSPTGLWIDPTNRMFVADTNNRRVQVFRLGTNGPHVQAGE